MTVQIVMLCSDKSFVLMAANKIDEVCNTFLGTFQVLVAVHREHKVKRENQQDATNSMFII